jgi:hypothetical protein
MNFKKEQIEEFKKKYGQIFEVAVDGKSCILHKPTRQNLSYASAVKDPIKMSEVMLDQLWVEGDEEIKTDDELFMAVSAKMDRLMAIKEAEVKKL